MKAARASTTEYALLYNFLSTLYDVGTVSESLCVKDTSMRLALFLVEHSAAISFNHTDYQHDMHNAS
jgi:hypothetical protein